MMGEKEGPLIYRKLIDSSEELALKYNKSAKLLNTQIGLINDRVEHLNKEGSTELDPVAWENRDVELVTKIDRLDSEIDRLDSEIDRLKAEANRLKNHSVTWFNPSHVLYVIADRPKHTKIGISSNHEDRHRSLEWAGGFKIRDSYITPPMPVARELETILKQIFKPDLIHGEWYETDFRRVAVLAHILTYWIRILAPWPWEGRLESSLPEPTWTYNGEIPDHEDEIYFGLLRR